MNGKFKTLRNVTAFIAIAALTLLATGRSLALEINDTGIVVYYFHRTIRCPSCLLLEEITRETIAFRFDRELENGDIKFEIVNVDEEENEHYVEHYDLSVQTIVVSKIENGQEKQWKKLDKVWSFLHDEGRTFEYIQEEIISYLN